MVQPTLRQLQYVVALADAGHFGRAAEQSHVTQPALSQQVRQLEEKFLPVSQQRDYENSVHD